MKNCYSFDYLFDADRPNIETFRRTLNIEEVEYLAEKEEKQVDNIKDALR